MNGWTRFCVSYSLSLNTRPTENVTKPNWALGAQLQCITVTNKKVCLPPQSGSFNGTQHWDVTSCKLTPHNERNGMKVSGVLWDKMLKCLKKLGCLSKQSQLYPLHLTLSPAPNPNITRKDTSSWKCNNLSKVWNDIVQLPQLFCEECGNWNMCWKLLRPPTCFFYEEGEDQEYQEKKRNKKWERERKAHRGMKKRVQEKQRTSKAQSFENLPLRIKCLGILVLGSFLNPKMYSRSSHIQCIIYGTCHRNRVFSEICEVEKSGG